MNKQVGDQVGKGVNEQTGRRADGQVGRQAGKGARQAKDGTDRASLRWMSAGIEFCGVIAIFCYIGYRLDKHLGFEIPFFMMTGFFISFIGMVYLFYKDSIR